MTLTTLHARARAGVAAAAVLVLASAAAAQDAVDPDQLFKQSRWEEAAAAYEEIAANEPENQQAWFRLGYALHAMGQLEEAIVAHETAAGLTGPATVTAGFNAACAHAKLGRAEEARDWLKTCIAGGFGSATAVDTDPDFDSVRDDDAFVAVRNQLANQSIFRSLRGPAPKGDRDQFDFWIGEWDSATYSRGGTGPWTPVGTLQTRVLEVLDGNALVEWSRGMQPGVPAHGFSIRTFDEKKNEWSVLLNWPGQNNPSFSMLTGRFRHERCEIVTNLFGSGGSGQTRFTFSDVTEDSYLWDSATTQDGGNTWRSSLLFEGQRRAADAEALTIGPSVDDSFCSNVSFRQLDDLLGRWTGTRMTPAGDALATEEWIEEPVRMHCYSVMDGSAVVEEYVVGEGDDASGTFAIQCFEVARGKWVRYALDDDSPHFRRFEGVADESGIEFVGVRGAGSSGAPGALVLELPQDDTLRTTRRDGERLLWKQELRPVQ